MHLSLREKQSFYEHLAQLIRGGIGLPAAVNKLITMSSGSLQRALQILHDGLSSGKSVPESFAALRPAISEMEQMAITALERSGRMDRGLQQLSDYFGALEKARREMLRRSRYPLFILHFGVLVVNAVKAVFASIGQSGPTPGFWLPFLRGAGFALFCFWGLVVIAALLWPLLRDWGMVNPLVDRILNRIPMLGKMRRFFALARFCATYDMQLEAGVNVMDSLTAAGNASGSAMISATVAAAVPEVRQGTQVGALLARGRAFPESFKRTFMVAEESGELDRALPRLTAEYQSEALHGLNALAEWLPRLVYLGILIYIGWGIVTAYMGYFSGIMRQFDTM